MKALSEPRVVYLRSSALATRLAMHIEDRNVQLSPVSSYHNMLAMMQRDRVDCLMASDVHLSTEQLSPADLSEMHRHDLVSLPVYSWIARKYENWKERLEIELRQLVSAKEWKRLYLESKASCSASSEYLCPDGRIFARQVKFMNENG
jgi:hypothetical protein